MAGEDAVENFSVKGLDSILKSLKGKPPVARVGILGSKNARAGKSNSNATIGAAHEFGTSKIPQRSFLRVPLNDHLNKEIEKSGALDKDALENVIKSGSVLPWLQKIAFLAEKVVLDAFDSQGDGKWRKWSKGYSNNTGMILQDTTQLRNSITSEVVE